MRGEYIATTVSHRKNSELPPRARRILNDVFPSPFDTGTTSACAENTRTTFALNINKGNYLRVRGEYVDSKPDKPADLELPPRARRIRLYSALAGCWGVNYLRVRGEYGFYSRDGWAHVELPPRARRIRTRFHP